MTERTLSPVSEHRFLGMVANEEAYLRVGEVLLAENYWLEEGVWRPKLGLVPFGAAASAAAIQALVQWETLAEQRFTTKFAAGTMFEYDWGTSAWVAVSIPGGSGVVIDPVARIDTCVSRGRLIVTDGVNRPWMLSVSAVGARTYTVLTEAPVARCCTVYYDKAFFYGLPGHEIAFEWSKEGDPAAGYDAMGQSWEFAQTDQGAVRGMAALNNTLDVLKQGSSTFITGAVDVDFQTAANREGLSETEGAIARHAIVIVDGDVYVLSALGPRRAVSGQRWEPLDLRTDNEGVVVDRLRDLWSTLNRGAWDLSHGVYDSVRAHVWWFVPTTSAALNRALIYHTVQDAWSTFTFPFDVRAAIEVKDPDGERFLILGDSNGNVYRYSEGSWADAGEAIPHTLRSRLYGQGTPDIINRLAELRLTLDLHTDLRGEVSYTGYDANGSVQPGGSKAFGLQGVRGKRNYRRGFRVTGRALGWELRANALDQAASVRAALTMLTAVGSEAAWG